MNIVVWINSFWFSIKSIFYYFITNWRNQCELWHLTFVLQIVCFTFIMIPLASTELVRRVKRDVMNYDRMFAMQTNFALPAAILNNELEFLSSSNSIEDEPVKPFLSKPKNLQEKLPVYFVRTYLNVFVIDSLLVNIYISY